jgi:very-short-patch-repair endonuclease
MKHSSQTAFARELRQQQTDAEKVLWAKLRSKQLAGAKFRRQEPIGPYIVDFVSFEHRLILEIDGGHHNHPEVQQADKDRTGWLMDQGFQIVRFWNNEVLTNIDGALERIEERLKISYSSSP